jgi:ketosteroid isomerase-like protein
MPEENVETVRQTFREMNAFMSDELSIQTLAERLDPQIEVRWHDRQTYPDFPQHLQGTQELLPFLEQWRDGWADSVGELLELIDARGDRVLGAVRISGRGRQSGVPIEIHFFQLWTIQDGKVSKMEYFRHRADALKAAGLPE